MKKKIEDKNKFIALKSQNSLAIVKTQLTTANKSLAKINVKGLREWWDGLSILWKEILYTNYILDKKKFPLMISKNYKILCQSWFHQTINLPKDIELKELKGIINLEQLNICGNNIVNINELGRLCKLKYLNCGDNNIEDISILSGLKYLRYLDCSGNHIKNLSPISYLMKLQELNIEYNEIKDLAPLSSLVSLEYLNCASNKIKNLLHLKSLIKIKRLKIFDNKIQSLKPLYDLNNLTELVCNDNYIPMSEIENFKLDSGSECHIYY